jgi:hypothetical protein
VKRLGLAVALVAGLGAPAFAQSSDSPTTSPATPAPAAPTPPANAPPAATTDAPPAATTDAPPAATTDAPPAATTDAPPAATTDAPATPPVAAPAPATPPVAAPAPTPAPAPAATPAAPTPARESASVESGAGTATLSKRLTRRDWFLKKFAGSFAELSTYIGTGTFYTGGYSRPNVQEALYLKPVFNLGTKLNLTLNARVYLLYEFTNPDSESAQRFSPLDSWLWLNAGNLYTEPHTKIRLSGNVRVVLPTSYESRYANMVMALGGGLGLSRRFEWGKNKDWNAGISLSSAVVKNFHTHAYRGNGPDDLAGCHGQLSPAVAAGAARGEIAPAVADTDACGGPLNTNVSVTSALSPSIGYKKLSLAVTMIFINSFKYSFDNDPYTAMHTVQTGQVDQTWGMISLAYEINDHLGVDVGLSSYQPALNSMYNAPRFPFFDFESGNAANYTQVFLGVNGTL